MVPRVSQYVERADFAATPLVSGEQTAHGGTSSARQKGMSENATRGAFPASEQRAATPTPRGARATTLLVLSVVNFLVAAGLLAWVLMERYGDGSSARRPIAIAQQSTATPLPVLAVQATPTHPIAHPTNTRVPPSKTAMPPSTHCATDGYTAASHEYTGAPCCDGYAHTPVLTPAHGNPCSHQTKTETSDCHAGARDRLYRAVG